MKTFFVVNPQSANGVTGKRWAELQAAVTRAVQSFDLAFTQGPMDAARITREALRAGFECVVAVGGDGTINEVVNGFFENGKPVRPGASLGVLPRGTGGDFRRSFDWDTDFDAALARVARGTSKPIDVGTVEYIAHDGTTQHRHFANICSFGVSGAVDREVNSSSKALGGKLSFMLASARAMLRYRDAKVRFSADDGPFVEAHITTLSVANGRYFGGGMKVAPDADVSDGLFDVTIWSGYSLADFALKQNGLYSGAHVNWSGTRRLRCKKLVAESTEEVLIDCDGEQPGRLPCTMTLLPAAISLRV